MLELIRVQGLGFRFLVFEAFSLAYVPKRVFGRLPNLRVSVFGSSRVKAWVQDSALPSIRRSKPKSDVNP